jgi:MFS family permease
MLNKDPKTHNRTPQINRRTPLKKPSIDPLSSKLFAVSFLQGIGVGVWTFLSIFILDLGGSAMDIGLLAFVPGLASTFMQMAWGRLGDRIGYSWRTVSVGFLFTSLLSLPVIMSATPLQLILASSIQAIVGSMLEVATTVRFAEVLEPSRRARFMGIYNPLGFAGNICGSFAAGLLIPEIGYKYTLLGYTVVYFLLFLIIKNTLSSPSDSEYSFVTLIRMAFTELKTSLGKLRLVFKEGGDYTNWCIGMSVRGFGIAMFGPILTIFLVNVLKATKPQIGAFNSIAFAVRLAGGPPLGVVVDKHGPKRVMMIGMFLAFIHPFVFMLAPDVSYLIPVYALSGLYWAFINSAWFAWQMNLIPKQKGVYAGLLGFINGLSWAFGPLLGGFLGDSISLVISAVISSSFVLAGLLLIRKVPETRNE